MRLLSELNRIVEIEKRRQKDQKEVGQFPDIADYSRLFNSIDLLIKRVEKDRRLSSIRKLRK